MLVLGRIPGKQPDQLVAAEDILPWEMSTDLELRSAFRTVVMKTAGVRTAFAVRTASAVQTAEERTVTEVRTAEARIVEPRIAESRIGQRHTVVGPQSQLWLF